MNNEIILMYFNIGFIGFICFFAIIGFFRGTKKSLYYLIVTAVVFGGGFLLSKTITNILSNYNFSSFNLEFEGIKLTTVNQSVPEIIGSMISGSESMINSDTQFKALVFGFIEMVLKLLFFIILVVLAFTVFKLIADIIWLFIRPNKEARKKNKKTIGSRFGGMGIGAVKGAFYMLLIVFPIAGIASVTSSIQDLSNETDIRYNMVFAGDDVIVSPTAEPTELDNIFSIFNLYNDSLAGKIYNIGKVDDLLFDQIFQLNVGDSKVKLRKELEIVANALKKAQISLGSENGFDQILGQLSEEDPELLKEIIDELSSLKLINVVVPVGIELVLLLEDGEGKTMLDKLPEGIDVDLETLKSIDYTSDIKKLGYAFIDLSTIIDVNDLSNGGKIDFLNLDPSVVKKVISGIAEMEIVSTYAPVGVSYLINNESLAQTFEDLSLSIGDLGLEDIEKWDEEIKQFGNIYEAVVGLQIKTLEDGGIDFSQVTEESINSLSESIFNSSIISNAIPVVIKTLTESALPEEFKEFMVFDLDVWDENEFSAILNATVTIMNSEILDMNFEGEFILEDKTIDDLARHLSSSKLIMNNIEGLIDYVLSPVSLGEGVELGKFSSWNDNTKAHEELKAIFGTVNVLASMGMSDANSFLSLEDKDLNVLLESELISNTLVNVLKAYAAEGKELDFLVGVDNENIVWVDSDEVDIVFTKTGSILSLTAKPNVSKFNIYIDNKLVGTTRDDTFDITGLDEGVITVKGFEEGELRKIFIAIGSLASDLTGESGFSTGSLTNLTDAEIDNIVISDILVLSIIDQLDKLQTGVNPFIIIPQGDLSSADEDIKLAAWKDKSVNSVVVEGEMAKLFKGLKVLLSGTQIDSFNTNAITALEEADIYEILKSEVLSESIIGQIESFNNDGSLPIVIPSNLTGPSNRSKWNNEYVFDANGNHLYVSGVIQVNKDGEITKLLKALKYVFNGAEVGNFDLKVLYGVNQKDILKSEVISETIVHMIVDEAGPGKMLQIPSSIYLDDINGTSRDKWYNSYDVDGNLITMGEIARLLDAIETITGGGDFTGVSFDISKLYGENQEDLLKSYVISETIVHTIVGEAGPDKMIKIPSNIYVEDISDVNRDLWFNSYDVDGNLIKGEIAHLLEAVKLLTDGVGDFTGISFDISKAYGENQEEILKSHVISETIVHAIVDESGPGKMLKIPTSKYVEELSDVNRNLWYNSYDVDGNLITMGEIAHLLDAVEIITGVDGNFANISFNINEAFGLQQEDLLKSSIISETMAHMIFDSTINPGSILKMASPNYVEDLLNTSELNRDKWYNHYEDGVLVKGEIAKLLDGVEELLGTSIDINSVSFSIDDIKTKDENIYLRSSIISETIVGLVESNVTASNNIPLVDLSGRPFNNPNNRDAWFNKYDNINLIEENEIAKLITSMNLVGSSFDNINTVDVDFLLGINGMNVSVDDFSKTVLSSDFDTITNSMIFERILSPIAEDIANSLISSGYLVEPVDGFVWLKENPSMDYDLVSFLNSLYILNTSGLDYSKLDDLDLAGYMTIVNNKEAIADGMVVSRAFKDSIAKMFNKIYQNVTSIPGSGPFDQSRYNGTNKQAHVNFVNDLTL